MWLPKTAHALSPSGPFQATSSSSRALLLGSDGDKLAVLLSYFPNGEIGLGRRVEGREQKKKDQRRKGVSR